MCRTTVIFTALFRRDFDELVVVVCRRTTDCGAVCHPRCLSDLPANCGVPSDYTRLAADVRQSAVGTGRTPTAKKSSASALHLAAYMKLLRLLVFYAICRFFYHSGWVEFCPFSDLTL